jgi:uncharacterized membrane protein YidH (DUF202 family)
VPDKTPKRQAEDFKDLVVAYAKQETLDPIKQSLRFVRNGVGGALIIALGVAFLSVGTLRMLQTETGLDGNLSVLVYVIVFVLLGAGAALSALAARRTPASTNSASGAPSKESR